MLSTVFGRIGIAVAGTAFGAPLLVAIGVPFLTGAVVSRLLADD